MDKFELLRRNLALDVLTVWYDTGAKFFKKYLYTNWAYRYSLGCKTRGLIAHDRALTGRIV